LVGWQASAIRPRDNEQRTLIHADMFRGNSALKRSGRPFV